MPIVLCDRCGHYADAGKSQYCELCGKQLSKTEYSSEDADNGVFKKHLLEEAKFGDICKTSRGIECKIIPKTDGTFGVYYFPHLRFDIDGKPLSVLQTDSIVSIEYPKDSRKGSGVPSLGRKGD